MGEADDIHPKNKQAPGERLARWALAKDYGRRLIFSGPLFQAAESVEGTMRVTFRHIGDGLKSPEKIAFGTGLMPELTAMQLS